MRKTAQSLLALWLLLTGCESVQENNGRDVDGVPLPNAEVTEGPGFAGAWFGSWDGVLKHILVLGAPNADGTVPAIYAYGDNPNFGIERGYFETTARVKDDEVVIKGRRFTATYDLTPSGRLQALYVGDNGVGTAMLSRHPVPSEGAPARWTFGKPVFLDANVDGAPLRMEVVIFRPEGPGPFPLAVVSHGSTGRGTDPKSFRQTWTSDGVADFLLSRGWMVAFPQRRGRGQTEGLYDEGLAPDRSQGYTCDTAITRNGFDRAVDDLAAAITALKGLPDVKDGRVLLAGQSRGGILSVGYAGRNPDQIHGVVNFVGGWLGEGCPTAEEVNQGLMAEGAGFGKPMLWIYGDEDPLYSLKHSRANYKAFRRAGGKGEFLGLTVPGKNAGHAAIGVPSLWQADVSTYLDQIGMP